MTMFSFGIVFNSNELSLHNEKMFVDANNKFDKYTDQLSGNREAGFAFIFSSLSVYLDLFL